MINHQNNNQNNNIESHFDINLNNKKYTNSIIYNNSLSDNKPSMVPSAPLLPQLKEKSEELIKSPAPSYKSDEKFNLQNVICNERNLDSESNFNTIDVYEKYKKNHNYTLYPSLN